MSARICSTMLCLALSVSSAHAWNGTGHRVAANIAYDLLDADLRARIVKLLKDSPSFMTPAGDMPKNILSAEGAVQDRWVFCQSAIWADLVRGNAKYHIGNWHFINLPLFQTPDDEKALVKEMTPSQLLPEKFALSDVKKFSELRDLNAVQAYQFCLLRLADPKTTADRKAIYFCWIMHIVSDLHQPLHAASLYTRGRFNALGGDLGGNSIPTTPMSNLHRLWDSFLGADEQPLNGVRGIAAKVLEDKERVKAALEGATGPKGLTPETWITESFCLCKEKVYQAKILAEVAARENKGGSLERVTLDEEYLKEGGRIARDRVALAGYRLAEIIKNTMK